MNEPITVLLVDDHAIVRQGIRAYLDTQPDIEVVGEAQTGAEAITLAQETAPDVVLMDLLMPDTDGVEATRALRRISPHSQVVILTSYHEDEHIFPAIKAGALSYLLKDIAPHELAEAVRRAARGEASIHPSVATRLVQEVRRPSHHPINPFAELSDREFEVLRLIAEGLDNATIAERLSISEKTVKSHVSNILGKLHLADRTQAAVFAWKEGIARSR
ncbi:MAG: DNA-binding response regulator [Caldilineae bacterium]|nr:MAG: DNA-binding response regulator [Caldilineae bacterium]